MSLTVILTISIGIGVTAAIFSVMYAVLLRPLPYDNPDRLVVAIGEMRARHVTNLPLSDPDFLDLQKSAQSTFEGFAAVRTSRILLPQSDGTLEQTRIASVTANFFKLLGAKIFVGRDFVDSDATTPPPADATNGTQSTFGVAILSYEYWQRHFGGDRTIVGKSTVTGTPGSALVVGILAPEFQLLLPASLNTDRQPDVWFPARIAYNNAERKTFSKRVIGLLRRGATVQSAQAEADTIAAELRKNFPFWQTSDFHLRLEPMKQYLVAQVQPAILALMGGAICLLLIACSNVTNLLLTQMLAREYEFAVRSAVGGNRWHLIKQMGIEAILLAGAGTLLGLGLAWIGIRELSNLVPPGLPRADSISINFRVMVVMLLTGLFAGTICVITPALRSSRPDVMNLLRAAAPGTSLTHGRSLRNLVVVLEVALSFLLLVGSGLMFRSFLALQMINPGFNSHGLLTFNIQSQPIQAPEERRALMSEIRERLNSIAGVNSVTAASPFPLADVFYPVRWGPPEAMADASKFQAVDYQGVLPGYFETMGTPIIQGRTFTEADNAPERNLAIIDESLAAKAFPRESAIGKRILVRIRTAEPEWIEVIGVVMHQRSASLVESGREQIYFTDGFLGYGQVTRWAIRAAGNPADYAATVRSQIRQLGRHLSVSEMQPMDAWVQRAEAMTHFSFWLIGGFASIAVLLAVIGIYGVLSTSVRQRTAEIGIRVAVGAAPTSIFTLVISQGLTLAAAGIALGLVAGMSLTRLLASMLVGVQANDLTTFVFTAVLFLIIAAAASWVPARRAARLDPSISLRQG